MESTPQPPPLPVLSIEEARVLGVLIEKQMTTPDYYPMTLNGITLGCNQKSNRDPVTQYDDAMVVLALDALRDRKLVSLVHEAGARVAKYRHTLNEQITLDDIETAILVELIVRGPQTAAELRQRGARMTPTGDAAYTQAALDRLMARSLLVLLPRQPGRKECRYAQVLCGAPIQTATDAEPVEPARRSLAVDEARIDALEQRIHALESELSSLRETMLRFQKQFE